MLPQLSQAWQAQLDRLDKQCDAQDKRIRSLEFDLNKAMEQMEVAKRERADMVQAMHAMKADRSKLIERYNQLAGAYNTNRERLKAAMTMLKDHGLDTSPIDRIVASKVAPMMPPPAVQLPSAAVSGLTSAPAASTPINPGS